VLQAADWLAASEERRGKTTAQPQPALARLIPPAARVALLHARPEQPQQLLPGSLLLSQTALFPDETVLTDDEARANYQTLVAAFEADLARIPSLETRAGLVTLLAVLRKHTSLLPHTATGETDEPYATQEDVSLFDHVKLTAAIAACLLDETRFDDDTLAALARNDEAAATLPLARLVRGEFSGIQEFIYRITRAEADKGGTARRLRGRSFYVSLLVEVITDWLVRRLELTPANILFCGGGRFDLLVPLSATPTLESAEAELNEWLLKKFAGELSVEMVYDIEVRAQDCRDFSDVYRTADDRLAVRKQQKLRAFLDEEWFYLGYNEPRDDAAQAAPLHALCPACHLSPTEAAGALCADCEAQGKIGRWLPKPDTQFLTFIYGAETPDVPAPRFTFAKPFHVTVALLNQTEANACIEEFPEREIVISRLNQTDAFILDTPSNAHAFDFKFLGNAAPVAQTKIATGQTDSPYLQPGDVFDFANIAELLTTGAQFLGVLKMDIDNLGMLFSRGLEPRTLARVSALSRSLDLFFCGWLNAICAALTNDWKQQHPSKQAWTDSLFYVVYSGGDDLLIVGPWDQMIPLAQRIRDDFGKFTGKNPSITLSGGAVLVKPHFPVHRFAPLADEELQQSKRARDDAPIYRRYDKDRFTIFQQTVPWETHDNVAGLQEMMKFANNLVRDIEAGQVPKSLLYFLLRLYDEHIAPQKTKDDWPKGLVWIPKFNYAVARRVSDQKIGTALVEHAQKFIHRIRIPISYVSLKTRKE
jgi:CRISPR-associated protein Csm1